MEKHYIKSPHVIGLHFIQTIFNVYYVATKEQNLQLKKFDYTEDNHICTGTNGCLLCGNDGMKIRYHKSYRVKCDDNFLQFMRPDTDFVQLEDIIEFIKLQHS